MTLARALVAGAPDAGDTAFWDSMGIPPEMRDGITASAAVTPLWPEHQTALQIFGALQTQWRVGMAGATGLDYAALPTVMELYQVVILEDKEFVW